MSQNQESHCLLIVAEAEPTALHRICCLLATLELIPELFRLGHDQAANELLLEIVMTDVNSHRLELLQRKLGQLVPVVSVDLRE